jgi:hypothetical protein
VVRLLSERREDLVAERTRALKAASTGSYETSCPAGYSERSRPTEPPAGLLVWRPPPINFGGPALRIRTLERKIANLNERIEAEGEASATSLT